MNQNQLVHHSSINTIDVRRIPKILVRRRFLFLGISCLFMSITGFLATNTKPNYQSSMQILVNSNLYEGVKLNNIPSGVNSELTPPNLPIFDHSAQIKLMVSSTLIQKAVDILRHDYPDITVEDIQGKNQKDSPLVVQQLESRDGINQIPSQIIEVSFNHPDPVKTQRVLQALQKVYQEYNLEQQQERLKQGLTFVSTRLPQIKKDLNQAEKNLENFRRKHNILDPAVQSEILLESLANIQTQQQSTRAQIKDVQARYNNLEQKIADLSQNAKIASRINQSDRYQLLLREVQKTEMAIATEQMRYTDESPVVQQLKKQHQTQKNLLQQELKKLLGNKATDFSNSKDLRLIQTQTAQVDPILVQEFIQLQTIVKGLIAHQNSLSESEKQLTSQLSKYPGLIAEYNRLLPAVETQRKILEQLLQTQQYLGLKISQGGFDWQLLEEPALGTATSNRRSILLLGGFVASPILAIAVALAWGMFNYTIYSVKELQKLTQLRLLGSVPKLTPHSFKQRLPKWFGRKQRNIGFSLVETNTWLPCHESLNMIYQNIQIFKHPYPFKSLLLTSALSREGKTTVALGLAASAARMHQRVLLIDANLQNPHLHKNLQLSNDWGLSLLLIDEENTQVQDYIQPIHPSIDILTAGPTPEDTIKLLSQQRMSELIKLFEQTYDLVIIDAPPILGTVDARILASYSQATVMVGRIGKVTPNELIQSLEILSQLNLVGIIANDVSGE
ncbi:polysaccharide biosynthesis tyrosine autokinase [Nodularia harveyana UHCC-0300]|uniref:non-specific protein-tyrosine kinase n=1 Tax=Nodularia harveyana UHCC-0300 TaxID=2974287 RepID=A0ABU5UA96_9CYAN|nr:polysaccharide biosynthesis tyrosine autokinase [Nodularia harveyana]MEA5580263.1 polysaccharide biosynthesis tyrosine autokinase [Nodularia harveyana UHCC-0300]